MRKPIPLRKFQMNISSNPEKPSWVNNPETPEPAENWFRRTTRNQRRTERKAFAAAYKKSCHE